MATVSNNADSRRRFQRFSDVSSETHVTLKPIQGYQDKPVVLLEEAVADLVKLVPSVQDAIKTVKTKIIKPVERLSVDESAAIMLYTMDNEPVEESFFYVLNSTLRAEQRDKLKPWFLYLKLVLTALERLQSNHCTVYRGVNIDLSKNYTKGKQFTWWGFSSCTISEEVLKIDQFLGLKSKGTKFIIECFNGKNISQHSMYPNECEVLILPGTRFEVIDCNQSSDLVIINLRELITNIDNPDAKLLKHIDSYSTGAEIDLNRWEVTNKNIKTIIENALDKKRCRVLHLSQNLGIRLQGVSIIASSIATNNTLVKLCLSFNRYFDDRSVQQLVNGLKSNSTLQSLDLSNNSIENAGAGYLADLLQSNKSLIDLCLATNGIHNEGMTKLAVVLANTNRTLQKLDVQYNEFADGCIDSLIRMLQNNDSLTHFLVLNNMYMTALGKVRLQEVGKRRLNP